ncbi:hypothetical protein STEG23_010523 [Scotinomys teguina]
MKAKNINLLFASVAVLLFCFSCLCISKMNQTISFALGITTINRRNHTYLKQTLTSVLSRMTPEEEKDSVVIVSVADTDDYLNSVVDMVKTKGKRATIWARRAVNNSVIIGSLIYFYIQKASGVWVLGSHFHTYLVLSEHITGQGNGGLRELEDDIVARKMYFTKMKDFVNSLTSKNWLYIEFSILGFIGKLFQSKDLLDFVHFFLMFYKVKPIDILLNDIFLVKMCNLGEPLGTCLQRRKEVRIQYRPSLFQHVGTHSSFPGRKQHLKDIFY